MGGDAELVALQRTLYESRNPTRRWLHTSRRDWIASRLERLAATRDSRRALEVGPGSGVYLPLLATLYEEVVASDVEPAYLEHARGLCGEHRNLKLVIDDIARTHLEPASFDLVLCSEVVEHLPDASAALASIRGLLRSGGVLVLSTPQRYSPIEVLGRLAFRPGIVRLVRRLYREPILDPGHVNVLTARQVVSDMAAAGFRIIEAKRAGLYLPVLAELGGSVALRLERRLEARLRGGRAEGLLWTQCYVAEAV
jgi:SAM-dependent methyltransferase